MPRFQVIKPTVALRGTPGKVTYQDSELYYGEFFDVTETDGDLVYGINALDGYPGWLLKTALTEDLEVPTHRVIAHSAFVYPQPDVKNFPSIQLPLGAYVKLADTTIENGYSPVELNGAQGWIWHSVVRPVDQPFADHVAVAESFLGVPYLWAGRSGLGIDCSALVQVSLNLCGILYPRDAFQQEELGNPVERGDIRRGDFLFAKGHVAIAMDRDTVIHANEELDSCVAKGAFSTVNAHYKFRTIKRLAL